MKILDKQFDSKIKEIVYLHNITQHYIILGEEIDRNFNSYIQPIKEFRDAYDHILRIMRVVLFKEQKSTMSIDNINKYIENQISKALGHEYRAFFDTADWFSIICRDIALSSIEHKKTSIDQIIKNCPKYKEYVEFINTSGKEISNIRKQKDIAGNIVETVNNYQKMLVDLYDAAMEIQNATILIDDDNNDNDKNTKNTIEVTISIDTDKSESKAKILQAAIKDITFNK